jgi:hypothetical protein
MAHVYHIVVVRVISTPWTHVWRLCFRFLRTGYDKVSLGFGEAKIGSLEMRVLWSSSTFCALSDQPKESNFFNNLYMGSPCSPSQDTKQLRVVRHPMSCWTSLTFFTQPISVMAEILSGFASMPHLVMMYHRSLP